MSFCYSCTYKIKGKATAAYTAIVSSKYYYFTDEDMIADDTELKNLWDTKIKPYFPWYY